MANITFMSGGYDYVTPDETLGFLPGLNLALPFTARSVTKRPRRAPAGATADTVAKAAVEIKRGYRAAAGIKNPERYDKAQSHYSGAKAKFQKLKDVKKTPEGQAKFTAMLPGITKNRNLAMKNLANLKKMRSEMKAAAQQIAETGLIPGAYNLQWNIVKVDEAIAKGKVATGDVQAAIQGAVPEADAKKIFNRVHGGLGNLILPLAIAGAGVAAFTLLT